MNNNYLLNCVQACNYLNIAPDMGNQLIDSRVLPMYTLEGESLFRFQDVKEYDTVLRENRRMAMEDMRSHTEWSPELYSPELL